MMLLWQSFVSIRCCNGMLGFSSDRACLYVVMTVFFYVVMTVFSAVRVRPMLWWRFVCDICHVVSRCFGA